MKTASAKKDTLNNFQIKDNYDKEIDSYTKNASKYIYLAKVKKLFISMIEKNEIINKIKESLCLKPEFTISSLFNSLDQNSKGYIDFSDLTVYLNNNASIINYNPENLRKMISIYDKHGQLHLNAYDFEKFITTFEDHNVSFKQKKISNETLNELFCLILKNEFELIELINEQTNDIRGSKNFTTYDAFLYISKKDNYIDSHSLNYFLEYEFNEKQLLQVIYYMDTNNDQQISYNEFQQFFTPYLMSTISVENMNSSNNNITNNNANTDLVNYNKEDLNEIEKVQAGTGSNFGAFLKNNGNDSFNLEKNLSPNSRNKDLNEKDEILSFGDPNNNNIINGIKKPINKNENNKIINLNSNEFNNGINYTIQTMNEQFASISPKKNEVFMSVKQEELAYISKNLTEPEKEPEIKMDEKLNENIFTINNEINIDFEQKGKESIKDNSKNNIIIESTQKKDDNREKIHFSEVKNSLKKNIGSKISNDNSINISVAPIIPNPETMEPENNETFEAIDNNNYIEVNNYTNNNNYYTSNNLTKEENLMSYVKSNEEEIIDQTQKNIDEEGQKYNKNININNYSLNNDLESNKKSVKSKKTLNESKKKNNNNKLLSDEPSLKNTSEINNNTLKDNNENSSIINISLKDNNFNKNKDDSLKIIDNSIYLFINYINTVIKLENKANALKEALSLRDDVTIKEIFCLFDMQQKNLISTHDFKFVCKKFLSLYPTTDQVNLVFFRYDMDNDNSLNLKEFLGMIGPTKKEYIAILLNKKSNKTTNKLSVKSKQIIIDLIKCIIENETQYYKEKDNISKDSNFNYNSLWRSIVKEYSQDNKTISKNEFSKILLDNDIQSTKYELDNVFSKFDHDNDELISNEDFIQEMNN